MPCGPTALLGFAVPGTDGPGIVGEGCADANPVPPPTPSATTMRSDMSGRVMAAPV